MGVLDKTQDGQVPPPQCLAEGGGRGVGKGYMGSVYVHTRSGTEPLPPPFSRFFKEVAQPQREVFFVPCPPGGRGQRKKVGQGLDLPGPWPAPHPGRADKAVVHGYSQVLKHFISPNVGDYVEHERFFQGRGD